MNTKPKGTCKIHKVGKLEYINMASELVYLCPVCSSIQNAKRDITRENEKFQAEKKQLKRQLHDLETRFVKRRVQLRSHIVWLNNEPQTRYSEEIKSREKFLAEHPESGCVEEVI